MFKKEMSRRRMLKLTALGTAVTTLAACSPKVVEKVVPEEVEKEAPPVAEKEVDPAPKEPITLTLHMRAGGDVSEAPIYVERPAVFMEEHPDINIELSPIPAGEYWAKITTMAAAGTIGDCTWGRATFGDMERHYRTGIISHLDDYMDAEGVSPDEYLDGARELVTVEGRFCAIPKNVNAHAEVYINEEMAAEKGYEFDDIYSLTADDLAQMAVDMSEGPEDDREVFGFFPQINGILYIAKFNRMFGSWEMNDEETESLLDNEEWYRAVEYVQRFFKQRTALRAEALPTGGAEALFAARRLGMIFSGRWRWKGIDNHVKEADEPFAWRAYLIPRATGPNPHPDDALPYTSSSDTHEMCTQTEHPVETFKFLYALGDQKFTELVAKGIGYLTARVDDIETIEPFATDWLRTQYAAQQLTGRLMYGANLRGEEVQAALVNGLDPIWELSQELTREFMDRLKADVDSVLALPTPV